MENQIEIYKSARGIDINIVVENETVWATQKQMSEIFDTTTQNITLHLKKIYKESEIEELSTCKEYLQVQTEGKRKVKRKQLLYNLDAILSVGYRVNSKRGTEFRQWATQRLKDYLVKGYAINQKRIEENKKQFLETLDNLKILTENNHQLEAKDILSLIQSFSDTFFALDSYDKNEFPTQGTQEEIQTSAKELYKDIQQLKTELIKKGEATELFAQEKTKGNLDGIFGNVFQSVFGQDIYQSIEEKAAHLLYFIIKNHPFNDGNKRSAAFSFIWLLHKAKYKFRDKITPETLTTLTILIAESNPNDKDKMIGIVLLLLNTKRNERI